MNKEYFTAQHINASTDDLKGNDGIGRYILLPGSDGRAQEISQYFNDVQVKRHSRGHHLYLGTIEDGNKTIDVAAIASGMGCPSMEIILHELFQLGAKRFLRVGTAGSLQPHFIKVGAIINVQASVRDELTTSDYMPITVPAVASPEYMAMIVKAAQKLGIAEQVHTGTVHCKSSLYAREFGMGPNAETNKAYINLLTQCGVLASEMETAALFIQSQFYNYQLTQQGSGPLYRVLCGAILSVVSTEPNQFLASDKENQVTRQAIELALESVKMLARFTQQIDTPENQ